MKSSDFSAKVDELISIYDPFDATPEEWKACKGSKPCLVFCKAFSPKMRAKINAQLPVALTVNVGQKKLIYEGRYWHN